MWGSPPDQCHSTEPSFRLSCLHHCSGAAGGRAGAYVRASCRALMARPGSRQVPRRPGAERCVSLAENPHRERVIEGSHCVSVHPAPGTLDHCVYPPELPQTSLLGIQTGSCTQLFSFTSRLTPPHSDRPFYLSSIFCVCVFRFLFLVEQHDTAI